VGFLRRLLGGNAHRGDQPGLAWYEIPRGGYFEVAGVAHHKDDIARVYPPRRDDQDPVTQDIFATLQREPQNHYDPNAVAVLLEGWLAGYIPKDKAPAWSSYLARLEAEGYRARVHARIWIGSGTYYLNLRAHEDAEYFLPSDLTAREAELAQQEAERQERRAARDEARGARTHQEAQAAEWRAAGLCPGCGGEVDARQGGRGRPRVYCATCRAERAGAGA
jgi:hypothetical protein